MVLRGTVRHHFDRRDTLTSNDSDLSGTRTLSECLLSLLPFPFRRQIRVLKLLTLLRALQRAH
jgi:hypothetical protein